MKALGETYKNAEVLEGFTALPSGGYVVEIKTVEDVDGDKPYLDIVFDIAEGDFRGYYSDEWGTKNTWAHHIRRYYNAPAMGVFKGFLKELDKANGTTFSDMAEKGLNEQLLVGARFGIVVGLEEYTTNTGNIGTRPDWFNAKVKPLDVIRSGAYTTPDVKRLAGTTAPQGFTASDDDMPF